MDRLVGFGRALLRRGAELSLAALALLTLGDVLGRYLFHLPVPGAVELTEVLMVAVIFLGVVLATLQDEHVVVDVFTSAFRTRIRLAIRTLGSLFAVVVSLVLGVTGWQQAMSALDFGDQTTILALPLAPVVFFMSVLLFVNALLQAHVAWRRLHSARDPR
ncbi:MAG TPA: TRAP transporter small permease [Nevskiaceae bacterium]